MHQWFTRRSLTVGTKRKRTQKGKPHVRLYFWFDTRINLTFISLAYWEQVAHNDNQHGLYHTEKPYNIVIKAGEGARQQGRREESGRSSSGQRHSLDWSKHFHRYDTQLYRKDERPTMQGGNQAGEVGRAPSEES